MKDVIAGLLRSFRSGETRFQLGPNTNLFDWLHVANAATAHVLAAKALVADVIVGAGTGTGPHQERKNKVDGEAFFITDDDPRLFWDFVRLAWRHVGNTTLSDAVTVVPTWLAMVMATGAEWFVWLASGGRRKPVLLNRQRVEYCCYEHTFDIGKAKERLGYQPKKGMVEEEVKKGVEWALREEKEKEAKKER
ncbi:MAG: hypothetical protein Q9214_002558 [Letrouitia sp. 1 TL-2023]